VREFFEGAAAAPCRRSAEFLPDPDQQRVILVEHLYVFDGIRLEKLLKLLVIAAGFNQAVPRHNARGVSIDDEDRPLERIKQNRISGLRSDALYTQQLLAETRSRKPLKIFQPTVILVKKPIDE
jgi:hypothetical protein